MCEPVASVDRRAYQAQARALDEHCGKCCHDPGDTMPPPARVPRELRSTKPAEPESDMVNHPVHYAALSPEPIDVIEGWSQDYLEGNITKYLARWKRKGGLEDLRKLQWYANRLVKREERKA